MTAGPEDHPHDQQRSDACPLCPSGNVTGKPSEENPKWTRYECDTCDFKITDTSGT